MELSALEIATSAAGREREHALDRVRRRAHGVVHTPPELARFVVRLADDAVRRELGLAGGLADPRVALVDPACGPGAFLAAAIGHAGARATSPRAVWAFDVDGAALERAGALVGEAFAARGWPLTLCRADTLRSASTLERICAGGPVVVFGNPPWLGGPGSRPAPHLRGVLEAFRRERDGSPLAERKIGVLADSYVRFLGWSLACVTRTGGVFALVTNGSFLDGPVHRRMRAVLCERLDALDVVDFGGNAMLSRQGVRDENVFGVRTSVVVTVGARRLDAEAPTARVRYAALRGSARQKLEGLATLGRDALEPLHVVAPFHLLRPMSLASSAYAGWLSLAEAMPFHREGVQTNRDAVCVDADRARLVARLQAFADGRRRADLAAAARRQAHYDPERARAAVARALARDARFVVPIAYRPGDVRWLAALPPLCHRPRPDLQVAMAHSTRALVSVRKDRGGATWAHVGVVRHVVDSSYLSTRSSCRTRAFPERTPRGEDNLAPAVRVRFEAAAGRAVTAADFVCYALAVLSSPAYRTRHDAALRLDHPRVPWPADRTTFEALRAVGSELASRALASDGTDVTADADRLDRLVAPWL